MTHPNPGETLILYLVFTPKAGGLVLKRVENGSEQPIYYVSNIFKNAELRYSWIEKVGYTLLLVARRLRP